MRNREGTGKPENPGARRPARKESSRAEGRKLMEQWLELYPPPRETAHEAAESEKDHTREAQTRKRLLEMPPQAVLDLHGFRAVQAAEEIDRFIRESVDAGLAKVLIVHGKGNHSREGGILAKLTAECVSRHPLAGENALSKGKDGGRGARWVILRQRSR